MVKVKGGCTGKRGKMYLTVKYQCGQRGTGLTIEYTAHRQHSAKTQVLFQRGDRYCLLYTTALTLD